MTTPVVFLDTAYLVALTMETDAWHEAALGWATRMERGRRVFVTTWAVVLELGNALSKPRYRAAANAIVSEFFQDPTVTLVPLTEVLLRRSTSLFAARPDKSWSLTDCVSFLVMRDQGIREALTSDEHFQQAGFRALLREPL